MVRVPCQPASMCNELYAKNQIGGLTYYHGSKQRGHGIGSFFRSLSRNPVLPWIADTIKKKVLPKALNYGGDVVGDVISGGSIKSSLKRRGLQHLKKLVASPSTKKKKRPSTPSNVRPPGKRRIVSKRKKRTKKDIFG